MPRSDKPISGGSLTDPISSSRNRIWTSHTDPEESNRFEPDGDSAVDPLTQEPVEAVVNLLDPEAPEVTVQKPDPALSLAVRPRSYEWTSVRSIEGRTYVRLEERREVDPDG